jgi:hypothetical protein
LKLLCVVIEIGKVSVGCRIRDLLGHLERHKLSDVGSVAFMARVVLWLSSDYLMIIMRVFAVWFLVFFKDLFWYLIKRDFSALVQRYATLKYTERCGLGNKANSIILLPYRTPSSVWECSTLIIYHLR